jgi:hypothetical protein
MGPGYWNLYPEWSVEDLALPLGDRTVIPGVAIPGTDPDIQKVYRLAGACQQHSTLRWWSIRPALPRSPITAIYPMLSQSGAAEPANP